MNVLNPKPLSTSTIRKLILTRLLLVLMMASLSYLISNQRNQSTNLLIFPEKLSPQLSVHLILISSVLASLTVRLAFLNSKKLRISLILKLMALSRPCHLEPMNWRTLLLVLLAGIFKYLIWTAVNLTALSLLTRELSHQFSSFLNSLCSLVLRKTIRLKSTCLNHLNIAVFAIEADITNLPPL